MDILARDNAGSDTQLVLLFGLGMIGSAIRAALVRSGFRLSQRIPIDWRDAARRAENFTEIQRACHAIDAARARLSLVWSAGAANFFSSEAEIDAERRSFEDICGFAQDLGNSWAGARPEFHYLSSAGGLFEGQRVVTLHSRPSPLRPYGRMKLEQERQLQESSAGGNVAIYRPSSVYGPMVRDRKHGLINHLIANAANRRISVLDANVMALRDYVYSGDIGEYVARRIAGSGDDAAKVHFLVSGRCASIYEVVSRIERVMRLKLRYRLDPGFGNSANITFSGSVLPTGWRPSTLDVGIRKFLLRDQPQIRPIMVAG